jgi:hypothetical protein
MLLRILDGKADALATLPPKRKFKARSTSLKKSHGTGGAGFRSDRKSASGRGERKERTFENRSKRTRKTKFTK